MTKRGVIMLLVFFTVMTVGFYGIAGYDAYVVYHYGTGSSLSWTMALLGSSHPFFAFLFGDWLGFIRGCLATHFFKFLQPDPRTIK